MGKATANIQHHFDTLDDGVLDGFGTLPTSAEIKASVHEVNMKSAILAMFILCVFSGQRENLRIPRCQGSPPH